MKKRMILTILAVFATQMLILLVGGFACSGKVINIANRGEGTTLEVGESVIVTAEIDADYEVNEIEVHLRDVDTDWEEVWTFQDESWSPPFTFTKAIDIPSDTPLGDNYRLEVVAPRGASGTGSIIFGYSMQVTIIAAQ